MAKSKAKVEQPKMGLRKFANLLTKEVPAFVAWAKQNKEQETEVFWWNLVSDWAEEKSGTAPTEDDEEAE